MDQLPPLGEVKHLELIGSRLGSDELNGLADAAPKLCFLSLDGCDLVEDLTPLAALHGLGSLSIRWIAPGADLSPLAQAKHLNSVRIADGQDVSGAEALNDRLSQGSYLAASRRRDKLRLTGSVKSDEHPPEAPR